MASLKEIKGRIASVNSTLKITSAMKMVASSKLRKAQNAIGNMVPYQRRLGGMLSGLLAMDTPEGQAPAAPAELTKIRKVRSVALVCFASNSSLCGGFNANVIRETNKVIEEYKAAGVAISVFPVGRKMADALRKKGYTCGKDFTKLSGSPEYAGAAALGEELEKGFLEGRFDRVELIYNHFKSTASQVVTRETYLPLALPVTEASAPLPTDYIVEPDRDVLVAELLPKVQRLKIYTVLLDTSAAEHAARTVAMQTATDNGNDLLSELTLEYNKGRQQKITAEILDLEGGALE